jgi:ATP-dependent protease ClpP protease subunit
MEELHLYLHGEIGPDDQIIPGGRKVFGTNWLVSEMNSGRTYDTIVMHINSPGGDVVTGFAIHDILLNSGKKITTIVEGRAASIATVVMLAGSIRKATKNSTCLIHNPWQNPGAGDAEYFRKTADGLQTTENLIAQFYNEKTGQTVNALLAYMSEEKEFPAQEAYELGFFTEILEGLPEETKAFLNKQNHMSKVGLIERLTTALKNLVAVEKKNADFATADGVTLVIETAGAEPAVGDSVSIDGQPAPNKDYTLANGKMITVVDGKITEVKPPAEKPADAPDPAAAAPVASVSPAVTEVLNTLAEGFQELNAKFTTLQESVASIQNKTVEQDRVLETATGAIELIGTSMQSAGFKKILNKQNFNEDKDETPKDAEAVKKNAIAAVRERQQKKYAKA